MAETDIVVTFDDMTVLSEDGVDVFLLGWDEYENPPPYFVEVADRRFSFTSQTFLIRGHSAELPRFVREQDAEGRTTLLVERDGRYLIYLYDPSEGLDDEVDAAGGS